jgi:hypothetical protein
MEIHKVVEDLKQRIQPGLRSLSSWVFCKETYQNCFSGEEAVQQLSKTHPKPEEAVAVLEQARRTGLIQHVAFKEPFQNSSSLFYRFAEDSATEAKRQQILNVFDETMLSAQEVIMRIWCPK